MWRFLSRAAIQKQLSMMKNGAGGLSIFVGLNGTKEELGLGANNYYIFTENDFDDLWVVPHPLSVALLQLTFEIWPNTNPGHLNLTY